MLLLYLVSGRVREATTYTIPELFEIRYGTAARVIATVCIVLGYVGILSSQFHGRGQPHQPDDRRRPQHGGHRLGPHHADTRCDRRHGQRRLHGRDRSLPLRRRLPSRYSDTFRAGRRRIFGVFANLPEGRNSFIGSLNFVQALGYIFPIFFLVLGDQNMIQRMGAAKDVKTAKQSGLGLVISEIVVCALIITLTTTGIYLLPNIDRPDTVIFQLAINSCRRSSAAS